MQRVVPLRQGGFSCTRGTPYLRHLATFDGALRGCIRRIRRFWSAKCSIKAIQASHNSDPCVMLELVERLRRRYRGKSIWGASQPAFSLMRGRMNLRAPGASKLEMSCPWMKW